MTRADDRPGGDVRAPGSTTPARGSSPGRWPPGPPCPLGGLGPPACGLRRPPAAAPPNLPDGLFALGVASGDPLPDGVVLWTRLAPAPLEGGGMPAVDVPVRWEVADRRRVPATIVPRGDAVAEPRSATRSTSTSTGLEPGRWYYYRFIVGDQVSPVGRTRTAPAAGPRRRPPAVPVRQLPELAVGLLASVGPRPGRRARPRALPRRLHLRGRHQRQRRAPPQQRRGPRPSTPTGTATGSTRATRRCRAPTPPARGSSPGTTTRSRTTTPASSPQDPAEVPDFAARRAAAYQAWWEHSRSASRRPPAPDLPIYRSLRLGARSPGSTCSTPASTATHQACGGEHSGPPAPSAPTRAAPCSAPTRRRGSARASPRRRRPGTCSPTRS